MKSPLYILHLEDDPNDAALIQSALEAGGVDCTTTRVDTRADFVAALAHGGYDLILSDYSLPSFDGFSAIELAQAALPDLPVILVSGTLGEEVAIDSLKNGATDYVLKQRLARLPSAVRRAVREVEERIERRRLEAQFIEAQKMEVIGRLAGGIAHDFNNILSVIMGYSDMMMKDIDPEDPMRQQAVEIFQASERAAALTRQLLIFSRKQTLQPDVIDLSQVVRKTATMLGQLINEDIHLSIIPGEHTGRVLADPGYIGQVLMNLTVNARDAMPNGGKLSITTYNLTCDESTHPEKTPGDYVVMAVSDTGTGMTDDVKLHLFDAFFTTKPGDVGTGLGLATCRTIVNQCGGCLDFESELGKGTTFRVLLPQVHLPLKAPDLSMHAGDLPRGTEILLVVEDQAAVRDLACAVLENQGYTVLSAFDGRDGLRVANEHQGPPIALVITDVIMPQMGGKVMAEWLTALYPDLKVLFTSGYTDDAIAHHGVLDPGIEFMAKPYTPVALARRVREVLDRENVPLPEAEKGAPSASLAAA